jgi:hypothetical protein
MRQASRPLPYRFTDHMHSCYQKRIWAELSSNQLGRISQSSCNGYSTNIFSAFETNKSTLELFCAWNTLKWRWERFRPWNTNFINTILRFARNFYSSSSSLPFWFLLLGLKFSWICRLIHRFIFGYIVNTILCFGIIAAENWHDGIQSNDCKSPMYRCCSDNSLLLRSLGHTL